MRYLTILFFILLLGYTLIKKRRFDYFTVLTFSTLVYYYPVIIGALNDIGYSTLIIGIDYYVYLNIIIMIVTLTISMYLYDNYKFIVGNKRLFFRNEKLIYDDDDYSNLAMVFLSIIGIVLFIYCLKKYSGTFGNYNKAQLLIDSNRFVAYFKYISLFLFVYSFINSGRFILLLRIISTILISYTFFLGHRSYIVLGLIGVCIIKFSHFKKIRLINVIKQNKFRFLTIVFAGLFFLFVKGVFGAFMNGNYDLVLSRLTDPNFYLMTLLNSESNTITLNLQRVVETGMKFSLYNYLVEYIYLIPILGSVISKKLSVESFSHMLNTKFNPRYFDGYGLGSSFLGESYSIGGIFTVVVRLFVLYTIIKFLISKLYKTNSNLVVTYLSVILPYFTFYVHRNSFLFLFITARAYLYILLLCLIIRKTLILIDKNKRLIEFNNN